MNLLACFAADGGEEFGVCEIELVDLEEGQVVAEVAVGFFGSEGPDELALDNCADGRDAVRKGDFRVGAAVGGVAKWFFFNVSTSV